MTRAEILNRLKAGNQRFSLDKIASENRDSIRRKALIDGQDPFAIILGCSDSRVVPELVFDTGIGELFIIRVAGNVANTSSVETIEYAVANLGIRVIVILSHQGCGAVTVAVNHAKNGISTNHLLAHLTPVINSSGDNATVNDIAKRNAMFTAQELTNRSSIIANAVNSGKLEILPAYYHLDTGLVEFL